MSEEEIQESGVRSAIGSTSSKTARRIEVIGEIDEREVKQALAKDRFGNFHLSTTFIEVGGEHTQADIRLEYPVESFSVIEQSLFMKVLIDTLIRRKNG